MLLSHDNATILYLRATNCRIKSAASMILKDDKLRDRISLEVRSIESLISSSSSLSSPTPQYHHHSKEDSIDNENSLDHLYTTPGPPRYDIVYANASLHWCLNHEILIPSIMERLLLGKGSVFCMQIPDTRAQMSHLLMEKAAENVNLANKLKDIR